MSDQRFNIFSVTNIFPSREARNVSILGLEALAATTSCCACHEDHERLESVPLVDEFESGRSCCYQSSFCNANLHESIPCLRFGTAVVREYSCSKMGL